MRLVADNIPYCILKSLSFHHPHKMKSSAIIIQNEMKPVLFSNIAEIIGMLDSLRWQRSYVVILCEGFFNLNPSSACHVILQEWTNGRWN